MREYPVMTLKETAAFLKVHNSTIYRLLKAKQIPAFRVGSDWRFTREALDRWCAEQEWAATIGWTKENAA